MTKPLTSQYTTFLKRTRINVWPKKYLAFHKAGKQKPSPTTLWVFSKCALDTE